MRRAVMLVTAIAVGSVAFGQTAHPSKKSDEASFSAHDLSGTWIGPDPQLGPPQHPGVRLQEVFSPDVPPMTAWAKARRDAAKPGFGPNASLDGNDPTLGCNPIGMPRLMTIIAPTKIIQIPDEIVIIVGSEWREIWMDGRKLPADPLPTWNGYSVGKWEGDTLVVDTIATIDKSWVDEDGDPHSDEMHLIERYRRVSRDTLMLTMTIDDPKAYTRPWVSLPRPLTLKPKLEVLNEPCVPEENEAFSKAVREPARAPAAAKSDK